MYTVPATSTLVLLFTKPALYDGGAAKRFLGAIDLSAGQDFKSHFKHVWDLMYAGAATRKLRMKQLGQEFLRKYPSAQVVSLGIGLDPLSIDLAESFPEASFFDVDMSHMDLKAEINAAIDGPSMHFVSANLANPAQLQEALKSQGWHPSEPTLVMAEGITYYVPRAIFAQALAAVRTDSGALVLEYSLPDEEIVDPRFREAYIAFYPEVTRLIGLPFPMERYSTDYVSQLAEQLGGSIAETLHEYHVAHDASGEYHNFFASPDDGVIRVALINF